MQKLTTKAALVPRQGLLAECCLQNTQRRRLPRHQRAHRKHGIPLIQQWRERPFSRPQTIRNRTIRNQSNIPRFLTHIQSSHSPEDNIRSAVQLSRTDTIEVRYSLSSNLYLSDKQERATTIHSSFNSFSASPREGKTNPEI